MAALSFTYIGADASRPDARKGDEGRLREVTVQFTPGDNATDEWLDLSSIFRSLKQVIGFVQLSGTACAALPKAALDKLGTAGAASAGALGVQINTTDTCVFQVTCRGVPR